MTLVSWIQVELFEDACYLCITLNIKISLPNINAVPFDFLKKSTNGWNTKLWCSTQLHSWIHVLINVYLKNDLSQVLLVNGFHIYADNTCISFNYKDFEKNEAALSKKHFLHLCNGFAENKFSIDKSLFL